MTPKEQHYDILENLSDYEKSLNLVIQNIIDNDTNSFEINIKNAFKQDWLMEEFSEVIFSFLFEKNICNGDVTSEWKFFDFTTINKSYWEELAEMMSDEEDDFWNYYEQDFYEKQHSDRMWILPLLTKSLESNKTCFDTFFEQDIKNSDYSTLEIVSSVLKEYNIKSELLIEANLSNKKILIQKKLMKALPNISESYDFSNFLMESISTEILDLDFFKKLIKNSFARNYFIIYILDSKSEKEILYEAAEKLSLFLEDNDVANLLDEILTSFLLDKNLFNFIDNLEIDMWKNGHATPGFMPALFREEKQDSAFSYFFSGLLKNKGIEKIKINKNLNTAVEKIFHDYIEINKIDAYRTLEKYYLQAFKLIVVFRAAGFVSVEFFERQKTKNTIKRFFSDCFLYAVSNNKIGIESILRECNGYNMHKNFLENITPKDEEVNYYSQACDILRRNKQSFYPEMLKEGFIDQKTYNKINSIFGIFY